MSILSPARTVALVRPVSDRLADCELTWLPRRPIDVERARAQHRAYAALLAELGCEVVEVPAAHDLPDAVFVEDTAVALDELAILARPGAPARHGEVPAVAEVLGRYRDVAWTEAPATLDGGDVLRLGRSLFVGLTTRTNPQGVARVRDIAEPLGYAVEAVPIERCLHLKSAVCEVADGTVLLNPDWLDAEPFSRFRILHVDPHEPAAANAVRIGETLVHSDAFPRTRERLEHAGLRVRGLDVSELAKAEGAVTCCSLLLRVPE